MHRIRKSVPHDRSVPYRRPIVSALLFCYLHYLSLVVVAAALVLVVARQDPLSAQVLAAAVLFTGLTWFIAFFKRRGARCPLCKGTPFLDSGALVSPKAARVFPLNFGQTAILSSLFSQRFRCMYCGTRYDLLKTPSSQLRQTNSYYEDEP